MARRAGRLVLAANLDTTQAAKLRAALVAKRGADLTLEGGNVQRLGGLCLQVLMAAAATWRADGQRLRCTMSEALANAVRDMGAPDLFAE